jgi:hypothetical protein
MDSTHKSVDPTVLALARDKYFGHMDPPTKVFGGFVPSKKKSPVPKQEKKSLRIKHK